MPPKPKPTSKTKSKKLPPPSRAEIAPQVDEKLNKARKPNPPVPLPIGETKRVFEDLNIGPNNHAALSLSFSNITRKYEGGLKVTSAEALAAKTRRQCVDLVHRRANGNPN